MAPRQNTVAHREIERNDPLTGSLLSSIAFHAALTGSLLLFSVFNKNPFVLGDPKSLGGGAVGVTVVNSIKMPTRRGLVNPVANDTESQIPAKPDKPEPKRQPLPDPNAIALKSKRTPKRLTEKIASQQKFSPIREPRQNQVYSSSGQAATTPLISQSGSGGVGSSANSPFGQGFAWYEQLLREKVSRNWRSEEIDARLHTAPPVVVVFEIQRDGTIRNVRVSQTSGNFALDQSAQRAILQSSPFPKLPAELGRDSATLEFVFRLQR